MKKFSTAAVLAFASVCTSFIASSAYAARTCEFLPNAPDSHVVVKGDTLWGISGKFLQHPWCWPQVWGVNKDQIRDPHWIYPGQVVYFDRVAGRLRLGKPSSGVGGDVRLSPRIRVEGMGPAAIPSIPAKEIEPFLSQPLIIEENELKTSPRIVATQEGHVYIGRNDKAYVRGELHGDTAFQGFRPGRALIDPVTKAIIGYEATYLGTLKLQHESKATDEAHTFVVTSSKEEMGVGDRLIPVLPTPIINYMPHAPAQFVDGRIVSVYGGVQNAGQSQIVTVNLGKNHGLDVGSVLQLSRAGQTIIDRTQGSKEKEKVRLPEERYGSLFIFRVFNNLSYGLVMQVTDSVQVGDVAKSPD